MYLSDFVTLDGERYYVSVDTTIPAIRLERAGNAALEQFRKNVLFPADQHSGASTKKGVSA